MPNTDKKHVSHLKSKVVGKVGYFGHADYVTAPKKPKPSDLMVGELAMNYANGHETLFMKNSENEIVEIPTESGIGEREKILISAIADEKKKREDFDKSIKDRLDSFKLEALKETTISEIVSLAQNNKLEAGMLYRITDYRCDFSNPMMDIKSGNHPFDIIVLALDGHTLSNDARAIRNRNDNGYFQYCDLNAWKLKCTFRSLKNGLATYLEDLSELMITYMKDEFENECYYDFKNIMFLRYYFRQFRFKSGPDGREIQDLLLKDTINQTAYHCYNKFSESTKLEEFRDETKRYYYTFTRLGDNDSITDITVEDNGALLDAFGKKISAHHNKIMPAFSIEKVTNTTFTGTKSLVPNNIVFVMDKLHVSEYGGCSYNTFDYNCYNITIGSRCNNNTFGKGVNNVILTRDCSENTFGDGCSQIIYSNKCNKTHLKGYNVGVYLYPYSTARIGYNSSDIRIGMSAIGISIHDYCTDILIDNTTLNNEILSHTQHVNIGGSCSDNKIGENCDGITITNNSLGNTISKSCENINIDGNHNNIGEFCNTVLFLPSCSDNKVGDACSNITFGGGCNMNVIGYKCTRISFNNGDCNNNRIEELIMNCNFGVSCTGNTVGKESNNTNLGDNCIYNIIGQKSENNRFGRGCEYNKIGDLSQNNIIGDFSRNVMLDNNVLSVTLANYCSRVTVLEHNQRLEVKSNQPTNAGMRIYGVKVERFTNMTNTTIPLIVPTLNSPRQITFRPRQEQIIPIG